jgi:MFS family permease
MMTASLALSSLLMVLAACSPDFALLLVLRAVQGVALAGLPAVAMAYLAEEVHPEHAGFTVGLYIAGNSVGCLVGRILSGVLTDAIAWRSARWVSRARELRLLAHTPSFDTLQAATAHRQGTGLRNLPALLLPRLQYRRLRWRPRLSTRGLARSGRHGRRSPGSRPDLRRPAHALPKARRVRAC